MCLAPILVLNRSHPLPSGGAARVKPPPSGDRWLRPGKLNRLLSNRSHPLPSGGSGVSKALHRLATGGYGRGTRIVCCRIVAIRCQAVEAARVRRPPSGDRWLRSGNAASRKFVSVCSVCSVVERRDSDSAPRSTVFAQPSDTRHNQDRGGTYDPSTIDSG